MQITERDIDIIHHVFRHRFLRSTHICQLVEGSEQAILRRLQTLYHHSYLERPRVQIKYYNKNHNQPLIYGIARKGAELLKTHREIPNKKIDWMLSKRSKTQFLEHTLEVADFMVNLETKWIKESNVTLIQEEALEASCHSPTSWKVPLRYKAETCTHYIEPDGLFALNFSHKADEEIGVILEVDRGTMPIKRKSLRNSSILRKLLAYETLWKQGFFKQTYGWKRVRVLFVVTNTRHKDRIQQIHKQAINSTECSSLFSEISSKQNPIANHIT